MSKPFNYRGRKAIQNIIKAFLEDAGYTAVLADDGLEGIENSINTAPI